MNRKFAAVLALAFAASGLFACSSAPAPVASADPVVQVGVQPYVAASSGCADRTDWCPAPTTIKLDAFRITVGNGWLSRYVTDWDTDLAKPNGYDTVSLTEEVALVSTNPGVGVADLLRGLVMPGATDLKFEPAPRAALGFETAAVTFVGKSGRPYYEALLVEGDHALLVVGTTPYPAVDAGLYVGNAQQVVLSVEPV